MKDGLSPPGDIRVFFPDATCLPAFWNTTHDTAPDTHGSWRVPPGRALIIDRYYSGHNAGGPVANSNTGGRILRGLPQDPETAVRLNGALVAVRQHDNSGNNVSSLGMPRPLSVERRLSARLEAGEYAIYYDGVSSDHHSGWSGWTYPLDRPAIPLLPDPSRDRKWQPDSWCFPIFWETSVSAGTNPFWMGGFYIPAGKRAVISSFSAVGTTAGTSDVRMDQHKFIITRYAGDPQLSNLETWRGSLVQHRQLVGTTLHEGIVSGYAGRIRRCSIELTGEAFYRIYKVGTTAGTFLSLWGWCWDEAAP